MRVFARAEGRIEDGVGVAVVGNHDVLIAAARTNREPTGVVCVEFADRFDADVNFVGALGWEWQIGNGWSRSGRGLGEGLDLGLGRANALAGLHHVAFDSFIGGWAVLAGVGVSEAMPSFVVAFFDGRQPVRLDGEASGCVMVSDEGFHAGQIVGAEGPEGG